MKTTVTVCTMKWRKTKNQKPITTTTNHQKRSTFLKCRFNKMTSFRWSLPPWGQGCSWLCRWWVESLAQIGHQMGSRSAEMTLVRLRLLVWRTWRVSWVRWGWRFSNSKWAGREAGHGDRGWKQRPRVFPAQEKKAPQLIFHRWTHLALSLAQQGAPLVAQTVKNLPAMREIWVRSLGQENTLENRMATHSSILVWRIESHG